jgi:UDP-N-acetylenolpyruvoylglucosamine reductase
MTPLPAPRGTLTANRPLADLTWLRVGGPADWLFQPADEADLAAFLRALDPTVPVFPMGVGSNLIVRDGGIRSPAPFRKQGRSEGSGAALTVGAMNQHGPAVQHLTQRGQQAAPARCHRRAGNPEIRNRQLMPNDSMGYQQSAQV